MPTFEEKTQEIPVQFGSFFLEAIGEVLVL